MGLDGWLILITVGFVFSIPWLAYHLFAKWKIFFARPEVWQRLATPGSSAYRPLWGTVMIYETAGNAVRLLCCIALAVLFYQRRRLFKPLMIAFQVGSILYLWLDQFLAQQVMTVGAEHVSKLIGQTVGTLLWTSYLLVSRRVKNTFVR